MPRKCPCLNCICLPICRNESSIEICRKCSDICKYIIVTNKTTGRYRWSKIIKIFNLEIPFSLCPLVINGKTMFINVQEEKLWNEKRKEDKKQKYKY
jgi:hypothetical protein